MPVANAGGTVAREGFGLMDDLLFLAHRIPYPPNKGDKICARHVLETFVPALSRAISVA